MDNPPELKRIAVITSGGDSPGMNAAIRAVVRSTLARGAEVVGFSHGYRGLIGNEAVPLESKSVGGIINVETGPSIVESCHAPDGRRRRPVLPIDIEVITCRATPHTY